jgi:hypothetical protein
VVDFLFFHNITLSWPHASIKAVGMLPRPERADWLLGKACNHMMICPRAADTISFYRSGRL